MDPDAEVQHLAAFFEASIQLMKVMVRACEHHYFNQFNQKDIASWHKDLAELAGIEWFRFMKNR